MTVSARRVFGRVIGCLIAVAIVAGLLVGVIYKQEISDSFRAATFEPSARVTQVLDTLDLTSGGERLFLASRPTVDGSQHFNAQCADVDHSEDGHVLGCYTNERIRLFDVTDERISDIVEVTAAHELLHAAYARLSTRAKNALAEELRAAYETLSAEDPSLAERMNVYSHLSDTAYVNELHSVLGTEVRELPESLERHYANYFADRNALLDRFDTFQAVFLDLQARASELEEAMIALRTDIEQRNADYDAQVEQFNLDAATFTSRNERFEFSSNEAEFEQVRTDLAIRRDALEATLTGLQADIDRYNAMREELQQLGQKSTELDEQLNSTLAPVTTRPTD